MSTMCEAATLWEINVRKYATISVWEKHLPNWGRINTEPRKFKSLYTRNICNVSNR